MKFPAILKDSLREALDTKVFYAMVGLSLLVILFIGSVGYRPVSVEEEAHRLTDQMNWFLRFSQQHNVDAVPRWDVKDFAQTEPGADPWQTGYHFALTMEFTSEQQAKDVQKFPQATLGLVQQQLRRHFTYLKKLQVTKGAAENPKEVRYLVTTDASKASRSQDWPHYPVFLFVLPLRLWRMPVGTFVHFWEDTLINTIGGAIALLISTIITAFFIPNMLRKGTVDMLVVKPISRWTLLLYKYIGGMTFMFLNTVAVVVGVWLVLGLRTHLWGIGFLFSIGMLTFQFAIYYAVSTLFAVLSRSAIVAILMAFLTWFLCNLLIGVGYQIVDATRKVRDLVNVQMEADGQEWPGKQEPPEKLLPDWAYTTADLIHFAAPHLKDLDVLTSKWILDDTQSPESRERKAAEKLYADFRWTEALTVNSLYIMLFLGLACWRFATRDY